MNKATFRHSIFNESTPRLIQPVSCFVYMTFVQLNRQCQVITITSSSDRRIPDLLPGLRNPGRPWSLQLHHHIHGGQCISHPSTKFIWIYLNQSEFIWIHLNPPHPSPRWSTVATARLMAATSYFPLQHLEARGLEAVLVFIIISWNEVQN